MTEFPQEKARLLVPWVLGCSGLACVVGVLVGWTGLAVPAGVLAYAALAGYVMLAGGSADATLRGRLLAAALVLAVLMTADGIWSQLVTPDFGWFAYASSAEVTATLRQGLERQLALQRWWALAMLVATGFLALAVIALPHRRRPRLAVATAALSLLMLGVVLADLWELADGEWGGLGPMLGAVWLPLVAAIVALVCFVVAGQRAGTAWLVPAGVMLLAVPLLDAVGEMAWTAGPGMFVGWSGSKYVLEPMYVPMDGTETSVAVSVAWSGTDPWSAILAAAMLAGPVLVVVGCLRATRGQVASPMAPPE